MNQFSGAWKLVAFEEHQPDGAIIYPYGPNPIGLLIYDQSGNMAVQIMRPDRRPVTASNWSELDAQEAKSAGEGFTAFFGMYEVDEAERTIVHHVKGHLIPNSVGKQLKRKYEFKGDRLVLKPSESRYVVWERIG
jgi:lipocalin-like protein